MAESVVTRRTDNKAEAEVRAGLAIAPLNGVNAAASAMYREGVSMPVVIRVLLYPRQRRATDLHGQDDR